MSATYDAENRIATAIKNDVATTYTYYRRVWRVSTNIRKRYPIRSCRNKKREQECRRDGSKVPVAIGAP